MTTVTTHGSNRARTPSNSATTVVVAMRWPLRCRWNRKPQHGLQNQAQDTLYVASLHVLCPRPLSRRRRLPGRATAKQQEGGNPSHHQRLAVRAMLRRPCRIGADDKEGKKTGALLVVQHVGLAVGSGLHRRRVDRRVVPVTVATLSLLRRCRSSEEHPNGEQNSTRIWSEGFCTSAAII